MAEKVKTMGGEDAANLFEERVLSYYPCVFHEWFVERFPEPTQWLASRNAYSRTAAVMSMVGYILGCEGIQFTLETSLTWYSGLVIGIVRIS